MKIRQKFSVLFIITALLLSSCGIKEQKANVLNLATPAEITSLDSLTVSNANSAQLISNFTEGLTTYSLEGEIVGGIAQSWTISEDQLTYTFHLRDAQWQNGEPVTAHDFVFAWQQVATLPKSVYAGHLRNIVNGVAVSKGELDVASLGVKALANNELQIQLIQPTPYLLDLLAFPSFLPVNEKFYHEVGSENYGTTVETVLANGPFKLTEYEADTGYKLIKNETYWDQAAVKLDGINVRVVKQASTRANLYKNGEIDQLVLTTDLHDEYVNDTNIQVEKQPRMSFLYLSETIQSDTSVLTNKNFRKAITYAIDKQLITDSIVKDGSIAADYFLPRDLVAIDGVDFRDYSGKYNDLQFNTQIAQEYLQQAQAELGTTELSFAITTTDAELNQKIYENIKAQIETNLPGVQVELKSVPSSILSSQLKEGNTPAASTGWVAGIKDPSTFFEVYQTGQVQNYGRFSNSVFDYLIQQTESVDLALDTQKRWNTFVEAEEVLLESGCLIPLYQQGQESLIQPYVKNLKISPTIPAVFYKYIYIER